MHKNVIVKRMKQAHTAEHYTAYKLHPVYRIKKLKLKQNQTMHDFVTERIPEFIQTLTA